jgi:adenine phosphoribosyltransferase
MPARADLERLKSLIRDVPDFPKPGIVFKDITPLLASPREWAAVLDEMAGWFAGSKPDLIAAPEARGFLVGVPVAERLGCGFVPMRKPGKLPWHTRQTSYDVEYGRDTLEVHSDAIRRGARVAVVDDVLALGGTIGAVARLVEESGGTVTGLGVLLELTFLKGRERLKGYDVRSLLQY